MDCNSEEATWGEICLGMRGEPVSCVPTGNDENDMPRDAGGTGTGSPIGLVVGRLI